MTAKPKPGEVEQMKRDLAEQRAREAFATSGHPRYPNQPPLGSPLYACTRLGHFVSGPDDFCVCCLSTRQEREK
jgi:hypothetical protein